MTVRKKTTDHDKKAVWEKPAPKTSSHTALSPAKKKTAKLAARRAGRPYPNLVDNMRAAKSKSKSKSKSK